MLQGSPAVLLALVVTDGAQGGHVVQADGPSTPQQTEPPALEDRPAQLKPPLGRARVRDTLFKVKTRQGKGDPSFIQDKYSMC